METQPNTEDQERQATALLELMASVGGPELVGKLIPRRSKDGEQSAGARRGSQSDLRYRSLVERLPVVTFMASLDDTEQEVYISPQIEALLGFTQEEWLDNPFLWYRQLHPDDREMWVSEFARTCSVGKNFRAEYRVLARDGRIVWVQGECQLIRDEDGRPIYLQGVAFDITHLKRAATVEKEKLAAEAANRAKSEFLARMSHEIRTPLNGVVGMVDLLSATGVNETQRRYLQLARQAADSLMTVINDILDFSKIEAGKVEIEAVEFDLYKIIEDLTELLAPLAAKKKLSLTCLLRPEVPRRLVGDPNRVRQILTNLINNALKFTQRGYINVRASVDKEQDQHLVVRVQVEDTGIGIPADRLNRLFQSFSQVDSSTTRRFGGTGLGLAISKRLAELMAGEMGVESKQGHGTTFWFTVRFGVVAQTEPVDDIAKALRDVCILAVEPDPNYRRILTEQLEGRLCPRSRVVGNDEALDAMRQGAGEGKPYNVALLPYGSPLAAAILSLAAPAAPVLLALLDIDDRTDAATIAQAGFSGSLHRPLLQSRLMDAIASNIIKRPDTAPQASSVKGPEPLKGLHLLVAEDNEMNQFVTQQILAQVGCTCEIVGDGVQAVAAAQRGGYDAVLMDCQMPAMDGPEAARRIREREASSATPRRLPIIALTAEALTGDREKCLAAGMDDYVSKPINPQDLFNAIAALTRRPMSSVPLPAVEAERPVDVEALLRRCMGDAQFAARTLEKFSRRALEDVELLRSGIKAANIQSATRLALNLKDAATDISANPLRRLAFEIETAGLARDMHCIEQCLSRLDREASRCRDFLPEALRQITQLSAGNGTSGGTNHASLHS